MKLNYRFFAIFGVTSLAILPLCFTSTLVISLTYSSQYIIDGFPIMLSRQKLIPSRDQSVLMWASSGNMLMTSDPLRGVCLYDIQAFSEVSFQNDFQSESPVFNASFGGSEALLITGHEDGEIRLWNSENGIQLGSIDAHDGAIGAIAVSHEGDVLVSTGYDDTTVRFWDIADLSLLVEISEYSQRFSRSVISPDGRTLALTGDRETSEDENLGVIFLWDIERQAEIRTLTLPFDEWVLTFFAGMGFSPDGTILAVANSSDVVLFWDVETGEAILDVYPVYMPTFSVTFSPDGHLFAVGGYGLMVHEVEIEDSILNFGHIVVQDSRPHYDVAFNPDGTILASTTNEEIYLWDMETGDIIATFEFCRNP